MPLHLKTINYATVQKKFRLKNNILERYYRSRGWVIVRNTTTPYGYIKTGIKKSYYFVHRIIWVLHTKKDIPTGMLIDHIDGNRSNNNINNLRLTTHSENQMNTCKTRQGRLPGTFFRKSTNRWGAQIWQEKKNNHLGYFKTEQEAHDAYQTALLKYANN